MKHVIIAGASRSGKTTLSLKIRKLGLTHYKMDSIKRGLDDNFCKRIKDNWEKASPKMSHLISTIINETNTDIIKDKEYYVIDTCHIFPKDIVKENIKDTIIVFLGYPNVDVNKKLKDIKKYDPEQMWTKKLSDEENIDNLNYGVVYSRQAQKQAKKYNVVFFDTSKNFKKVINEAYKYIRSELNEKND